MPISPFPTVKIQVDFLFFVCTRRGGAEGLVMKVEIGAKKAQAQLARSVKGAPHPPNTATTTLTAHNFKITWEAPKPLCKYCLFCVSGKTLWQWQ